MGKPQKTHDDIRQLVKFAIENDIPLTPRAAGTSLSGQPIGKGIVVDVGRYMNQVLEVNKEESWARIQPGVIRNELNEYLEPYGLFFGPETSTQNFLRPGDLNPKPRHDWRDDGKQLLRSKFCSLSR